MVWKLKKCDCSSSRVNNYKLKEKNEIYENVKVKEQSINGNWQIYTYTVH